MIRRLGLGLAAAACLHAAAAAAGPEVRFNQADIETHGEAAGFDLTDPMAVFAHVFSSLPAEVSVYPTENYYYFSFEAGGVPFAGNLRLDAADRDDGVLHFAYFVPRQPWVPEGLTTYRQLGRDDGVGVERLEHLRYAVTYGGRRVVFALNDLSDVRPPDTAVRASERFLGPVFDESGIPFYLLFDEARKAFLFVLDEREPVADELVRVHPDHPALSVGLRTGFAFYEDREAPRKILVGVNLDNVSRNNANDGPFDQLPDNFLEGDELRKAILAANPALEGRIDRFGGFATGEGRFLIAPYYNYETLDDLRHFLRCADPALDADAYRRCVFPTARD